MCNNTPAIYLPPVKQIHSNYMFPEYPYPTSQTYMFPVNQCQSQACSFFNVMDNLKQYDHRAYYNSF